ncbi:MAG: tetratricopeptide repeat protein [Bacteroidales bacterium]
MITPENLIRYIDSVDDLNLDSLKELEELIRKYPYFQSARTLFLLNLVRLRSLRVAEELHRTVVHSTDRRKLFALLDDGEFGWVSLLKERELSSGKLQQEEDMNFSLIESYLSSAHEEPFPEELEDLFPFSPLESSTDYVSSLLEQPDLTCDDEANLTESDLEKRNLIDSFIEKGEKSAVFIPPVEPLPEPPKGISKEDSLIKEDSFLTESLAKIYIKQKKYSKALEIIKKLSLKYPEKNVYFADQIRFLEKIITNIKTE